MINKIVFTSPEAMVEFSGGKRLKLGLSACQKYSFERSRYFFLDVNKPLGLQIAQGSESHFYEAETTKTDKQMLTHW